MNSAIQTNLKSENVAHARQEAKSQLADFWVIAEQKRFGIIALLFIIVPCLAGIAASTALDLHNMTLFVIAGAPAMVVETLILGLASMRSVLIASAISCIISIAVIII